MTLIGSDMVIISPRPPTASQKLQREIDLARQLHGDREDVTLGVPVTLAKALLLEMEIERNLHEDELTNAQQVGKDLHDEVVEAFEGTLLKLRQQIDAELEALETHHS